MLVLRLPVRLSSGAEDDVGVFWLADLCRDCGGELEVFQNRNTFNVGGEDVVCINDIAVSFSMSCNGVMFDRKGNFAQRANHFLGVVVGIHRVVSVVEHRHNGTIVSVFGG